MERKNGSKYSGEGNATEIAKMIRADLKVATQRGEFPKGVKFSVTVSKYAGGQSINTTIKALPGVVVCRRAFEGETDRSGFPVRDYLVTEEAQRYVNRAEAIMEAYNYDGSDSMCDYFDVNFYGHARLDEELYYGSATALAAQDGNLDAVLAVGLKKNGLAGLQTWRWNKEEKEGVVVWLDSVEQGQPAVEPVVVVQGKIKLFHVAQAKTAKTALRRARAVA